jgi:hypothetical protein
MEKNEEAGAVDFGPKTGNAAISGPYFIKTD